MNISVVQVFKLHALLVIFNVFGLSLSQLMNSGCTEREIASALTVYDGCLQGVMNQLFRGSETNQNLATFLQHFCESTKDQQLDFCQNELQRSMSMCANDKQKILLEVMKKSNRVGIEFLCQDSGRKLREFRESDGSSCLTQTIPQQGSCVYNHPLLSMYIDEYGENFCSITQPQGLLCLEEVIQSSTCSPSSADFLIGYYKSMVAATPCAGCTTKASLLAVALSMLFIFFNQKRL